MNIEEYIKKAKADLDAMESLFIKNNEHFPNDWPIQMDEELWADQELAYRFSLQ